MLNQDSLNIVDCSYLGKRFKKPIYDSYGFARLPDTTTRLLTGASIGNPLPAAALGGEIRRFGKVLVILLDAFGWVFMDKALKSGKYPFLERIAKKGVISKLSTQFPSTTTAQITTIRYGRSVGEHGLYEWNIYDPAAGEVMVPFRFAPTGAPAESFKQDSIDPDHIYPPGQNYYQQLASQGIRSYLFEPIAITSSTYNIRASRDATVSPYRTLSEGLVDLGTAISNAPGYYYLYYEGIDTVCHRHGPDSPHVQAEIDTVLTALERILYPLLEHQHDLALLLTADHGQARVDSARPIYLNRELPKLADWMKRDKHGDVMKLAGSCRDVFLHLQPEFIEEAETALKKLLFGRAEVYRTSELMQEGCFGPVLSERFRVRIADLVILCYDNESAYWYNPEEPIEKKFGSHGGLESTEAQTFLGYLLFE